MTRARLVSTAIQLLSLAGLILSANLLAHHVDSQATGLISQFCGENQSGCADVLGGRWAMIPPDSGNSSAGDDTFAIPSAMLGLFYFSILSIWWLFIGRPTWERRRIHLIPIGLVAVGCLASVGFIWIMANVIHQWCPLCLATHVINFGLLPCVILSWPEQPQSDSEDSAGISAPSPAHPTFRLTSAVLALGVVLCAGIWVGTDSLKVKVENTNLAEELAQFREDADIVNWLYERQKKEEIAVRSDDPIVAAKASKKATLVLFTDFQCPFCHDYEKMLIREAFPKFDGHMEIVFKHFPLCRACNEAVTSDMHPLACEAAYLAEAARLQGGIVAFLKMKAALSEPREQLWSEDEIALIARRLDLDYHQLQADRRSKAISDRVSEDIAEGNRLNIDGTPTAFLNGRRLEANWSQLPVFWELMAASFGADTDASAESAVAASSRSTQEHAGSASVSDVDIADLEERGHRFAEELIQAHDSNSDGALQSDEWSELPRSFVKYDSDHDGTVTTGEIAGRFVRLHSTFKTRKARQEFENAVFNAKVKSGAELSLAGPTLNHGQFDLKDHRGKVVLIKFWASWCPSCQDDTPVLVELYRKYKASGFEIVGVSLDKSREELVTYLEKTGVTWPEIVYEPQEGQPAENPLADEFGVFELPTMILVSRDGTVAVAKPRSSSLDRLVSSLVSSESIDKPDQELNED